MSEPSQPSRIESVVVYRRGAEVTRVAELATGAGRPDHVVLGGLPLCLEDSSLAVRVRAAGPGPRATDVRVTLGVTPADPALPPPDDEELRAARQTVDRLQDQLQQVEEARERLEAIPEVERPEGAEGQPPPPAPVAARRALVAFRHEQLEAADARRAELGRELRDAQERHADLEARVRSSARQARPHELRKGARIALQWAAGATAEGVTLELRYRVPGACWAPAYSLALDRELTRGELAVRAVVAQRTGEDWTGVPLAVSTAAMQRWFDLPELQALRIGRRQPPPPRTGWRPAPTGADALYDDFDRAAEAAPATPQAGFAVAANEVEDVDYDAFDDEAEAEELCEPMPALPVEEADFARSEFRDEPFAERAKTHDLAPPAPPPAPQAAPAPRAMKRKSAMPIASRAASAVFGGVEDAMMPQALSAGMAPGRGGGPPPPPAPLEAAADQLAYGELRMPGPREGRRGRLVLVHRRERVRELIRYVEAEIEFDAVEVLERATADAAAAGRAGLPARHHPPAAEDGFDAVYIADSAVDVPSDGEFHAVPLLARSGDVTSHHVVVPREATDVFRVAELHNPLAWPLLRGPAEVYVGGDYLLTTELPAAPPHGEVRLGLGVDQAVKVARNTHFEEQSAGLIKGSLVLTHEIRVEIANRRESPVDLEVRERIPTVRDKEEDIEVRLGAVEPPWESWEPEDHTLRGGHRWRVRLEPGTERTLSAEYTVKIAAKHELVGGNRREV